MCNLLQVELSHYINGHGFDTVKQDNGVVVFIPVYKGTNPQFIHMGNEAHFVTNYREARLALGY